MRGQGFLRTGLLLVAVGLGGPDPAHAQPPAETGWDALVAAGLMAPADAWPVPNGSASGSRMSAARPLTGELETAWTFETNGQIAGEPVVARDRVVVEAESADHQRVLHVLSLATGREMYRKAFGPGPRLRPVLIGDRVVVCAKENRLEGHQVGQRMLTKRWEHPMSAAALAGALTHAGRVLIPGPGTVEILSPIDGKTQGTLSFRGECAWAGGLAARGSRVYALTVDAVGNLEVQPLELDGGGAARPVFVGVRNEEAPESPWGDPALVAGPNDLFVLHRSGVKTASESSANASWLSLDEDGAPAFRTVLDLAGRPTFSGTAWVGLLRDREGGVSLVRYKGPSKDGGMLYDLFATPKHHPAWARAKMPLGATRDVVLAGLSAFRPETREVLREQPDAEPRRAIPVKDLLLTVEGSRTVLALREKRGPALPPEIPLVTDPKAAAAGALGPVALVLDDGSVVEASVSYDPTARVLSPSDAPKDKRTWPIDGIRTIVGRTSPARLLFARALDGLRTDLAAIADAAGAKGWVSLASDAVAAGDAARASAALAEARRCDAPEADVARVEKAYLVLAAKPRTPSAAARAGLDAREAALRQGLSGLVGELVDGLGAEAPVHRATALWRAALARDPTEPRVAPWIRTRLPKGLALGEPFDPSDALDLVEADAEAAVRIVVPPAPGQHEADLTWSQKHLGAARYHWRKDLVGIESGELLLLTPVGRPGRLSHCLSLGRLVARTLEEMFASGRKARTDPWPLLQHLYESKEEYLRESTKKERGMFGEAARRGLEHTAGHFDPDEGLTRVFVPDGDDGFEQIRETYAHELTHHWMQARCPLFAELEVAQGAGGAGMWVVEGLADFVAGMRFDLARRRVGTFSPTASYLDVVAHAERPIDWTWLYGAPRSAAYALASEPEIQVPVRRRLGQHLVLSPVNLFYAQSAATCAYLWHAEGGRHRKAFLELVAARYTGTLKRGDFAQRLGVDEATLGKRVVEWSRRALDGKGP